MHETMNLDTAKLRQVFDNLDGNKQDYITVEQFTDALEKFYKSMPLDIPDGAYSSKNAKTQSIDFKSIVKAIDSTNDGIISFDDFQSAFQDFFNSEKREDFKDKTMTVDLHGQLFSFTPEDFLLQNAEYDSDLKTEDSGFLEASGIDCTPPRPSTLLVSGLRQPSSRRRTTQNSSARSSIPIFHENTGSPFSCSRSDSMMMDDVDNNFEQLRNQMRKMEEKMESLIAKGVEVNEADGSTERLREENARLTASLVVLEERLKYIEPRYRRDLLSERSHMEFLLARSKRSYETEIENLRARQLKLETDLSETTTCLHRARLELNGARSEGKRTAEALLEAQDKINSLTEQLTNRFDEGRLELQKAIADRDNALNMIKEVNSVVGNGRRGSISMDTIVRLEEMQQIIQRLWEDNKRLTNQVQDTEEESWFNNLHDGQKLLFNNEITLGAETDRLTKEEVVDLLMQEKHANNQLRAYLNKLLERIMLNHPELLEHK